MEEDDFSNFMPYYHWSHQLDYFWPIGGNFLIISKQMLEEAKVTEPLGGWCTFYAKLGTFDRATFQIFT